MDEKNLKELIKIPDGLDDAVLMGIKRGKRERKREDKRNFFRKGTVAAGIAIGATGACAIVNPEIVSAIPIINSVFESFNTTLFGEPTEKFKSSSQVVGSAITSNGSTITLNEVVVDENLIVMTLLVESDFLNGYEGKNEEDFFNLNYYTFVDGEEINAIDSRIKKIDENKGAIILTYNIADLKIENKVDIKLEIDEITRAGKQKEGKWKYTLAMDKNTDGKRIDLGESIKYKGSELVAKELVTSKLTNTLILDGIDNNENFMIDQYIVRDNNGKYFGVRPLGSSLYYETGKYESKLEIVGDLSNSEYIELIQIKNEKLIYKAIDGVEHSLLKTTGSKDSEYENKVISRSATEEEIKAGYTLDKVYYYISIDKANEFKKINELIATSIDVGNGENIIIKNIETSNDTTKVIFESKGMYDYRDFSNMIILDEEMNALARSEGQRKVAIEDEANGLYSMTLDSIDINKKYKIAIPMLNDFKDEDISWKMKIELN